MREYRYLSKNLTGQFFGGIFFLPFLESKVDFDMGDDGIEPPTACV
jgi:hypothetical protein